MIAWLPGKDRRARVSFPVLQRYRIRGRKF
jgi:hypothetical protein